MSLAFSYHELADPFLLAARVERFVKAGFSVPKPIVSDSDYIIIGPFLPRSQKRDQQQVFARLCGIGPVSIVLQ